jgi:hypothetical protein
VRHRVCQIQVVSLDHRVFDGLGDQEFVQRDRGRRLAGAGASTDEEQLASHDEIKYHGSTR